MARIRSTRMVTIEQPAKWRIPRWLADADRKIWNRPVPQQSNIPVGKLQSAFGRYELRVCTVQVLYQ